MHVSEAISHFEKEETSGLELAKVGGMQERTVLVVDDDPVMVRLLEKHLTSVGYKVLKSDNGEDALRLVLSEGPCIVVTDWEMPGMDGLDLCRAVRSAEGVGIIHIIMLTSYSEKHRVVEAFDAGADDYLSKPFDRGELLARIKAGTRVVDLEADLARRSLEIHKINAELTVLNNKLEKMATTDELTELSNRRHAMERLQEIWSTTQRYGQALSCVMLDVDHFKRVNDTYGHHVGDIVLHRIANILEKETRVGDLVSRHGGEEFLVICPNSNTEETCEMAERLRLMIEATSIATEHTSLNITVSMGVAERGELTLHEDELLKKADDALYLAKSNGRNRVEILDEESCHTSESPEQIQSDA
jgi:diguanylate cyclase (GGDEF)-like protein